MHAEIVAKLIQRKKPRPMCALNGDRLSTKMRKELKMNLELAPASGQLNTEMVFGSGD